MEQGRRENTFLRVHVQREHVCQALAAAANNNVASAFKKWARQTKLGRVPVPQKQQRTNIDVDGRKAVLKAAIAALLADQSESMRITFCRWKNEVARC